MASRAVHVSKGLDDETNAWISDTCWVCTQDAVSDGNLKIDKK